MLYEVITIGKAGCEVNQPLRKFVVRRLKIENHRDLALELVRHLLGIVEVPRDNQVDLNIIIVIVVHGTQDTIPGSR